MRIVMLLAVAAAGLAACESEDQMKERFRTQLVTQCQTDMGARATPGLDTNRFCTCLGERAIAGRSAADIRKLEDDATGKAAGEAAAMQCLSEQGIGGAPGGAPAAGGAPAPAPVPAPDVSEAADEAEDGNDQ